MAIQPIGRDAISNVNYIQSKTKADKFIEKISGFPINISSKNKDISSLKENDIYTTSDSGEIENEENTINKSSLYDSKSINFPASSKTTAYKFVQQVSNVSNEINNSETDFGFVDIGSTEQKVNSAKPNELRKISLKTLDKTNFQNKVADSLHQLPIKTSLKELLITYFEKNKNVIISSGKKEDEAINHVVNSFINDVINDLLTKVELAESLLDLTISPSLNIEVSFLIKLREIISDLDNSLRELHKQTEAKKKDSKVEIKIKRFNPKELMNNTI